VRKPCGRPPGETHSQWPRIIDEPLDISWIIVGTVRIDPLPVADGTPSAMLTLVSIRSAAVTVGHAIAKAWALVVNSWLRGRAGVGTRYYALDALRRAYVFGSLNRREFKDGVQKLGRHRREPM
jgi:hypothetical protein